VKEGALMAKKYVDFNSDMGESFGLWKMGDDEQLLDYVTSANIACGFHGGDANVMEKTVRLAKEKGVAVGCHFGLPDIEGFGRRRMVLPPQQIANYTTYQLGALEAFLRKYGMRMQHAKIHGALFSMAAESEEISEAILGAIRDFDPKLLIIMQEATKTHHVAKRMGFRVVDEFYVDRGAQESGQLVFNYSWEDIGGSFEAAAMRLIRMLEKGEVVANTGKVIKVSAPTFCIHGDSPNVIELAKTVKAKLLEHGYELKPIGEWA